MMFTERFIGTQRAMWPPQRGCAKWVVEPVKHRTHNVGNSRGRHGRITCYEIEKITLSNDVVLKSNRPLAAARIVRNTKSVDFT